MDKNKDPQFKFIYNDNVYLYNDYGIHEPYDFKYSKNIIENSIYEIENIRVAFDNDKLGFGFICEELPYHTRASLKGNLDKYYFLIEKTYINEDLFKYVYVIDFKAQLDYTTLKSLWVKRASLDSAFGIKNLVTDYATIPSGRVNLPLDNAIDTSAVYYIVNGADEKVTSPIPKLRMPSGDYYNFSVIKGDLTAKNVALIYIDKVFFKYLEGINVSLNGYQTNIDTKAEYWLNGKEINNHLPSAQYPSQISNLVLDNWGGLINTKDDLSFQKTTKTDDNHGTKIIDLIVGTFRFEYQLQVSGTVNGNGLVAPTVDLYYKGIRAENVELRHTVITGVDNTGSNAPPPNSTTTTRPFTDAEFQALLVDKTPYRNKYSATGNNVVSFTYFTQEIPDNMNDSMITSIYSAGMEVLAIHKGHIINPVIKNKPVGQGKFDYVESHGTCTISLKDTLKIEPVKQQLLKGIPLKINWFGAEFFVDPQYFPNNPDNFNGDDYKIIIDQLITPSDNLAFFQLSPFLKNIDRTVIQQVDYSCGVLYSISAFQKWSLQNSQATAMKDLKISQDKEAYNIQRKAMIRDFAQGMVSNTLGAGANIAKGFMTGAGAGAAAAAAGSVWDIGNSIFSFQTKSNQMKEQLDFKIKNQEQHFALDMANISKSPSNLNGEVNGLINVITSQHGVWAVITDWANKTQQDFLNMFGYQFSTTLENCFDNIKKSEGRLDLDPYNITGLTLQEYQVLLSQLSFFYKNLGAGRPNPPQVLKIHDIGLGKDIAEYIPSKNPMPITFTDNYPEGLHSINNIQAGPIVDTRIYIGNTRATYSLEDCFDFGTIFQSTTCPISWLKTRKDYSVKDKIEIIDYQIVDGVFKSPNNEIAAYVNIINPEYFNILVKDTDWNLSPLINLPDYGNWIIPDGTYKVYDLFDNLVTTIKAYNGFIKPSNSTGDRYTGEYRLELIKPVIFIDSNGNAIMEYFIDKLTFFKDSIPTLPDSSCYTDNIFFKPTESNYLYIRTPELGECFFNYDQTNNKINFYSTKKIVTGQYDIPNPKFIKPFCLEDEDNIGFFYQEAI